ncbi:MAG: YitT family protein [Lachnospiraceae bacterium]|nr:YitT family protein [Lachnospiraceae bacterium]
MREETKKELKDIFDLKRLFFVILGNTIYAAGIAAFVLPTGLITGGTTGLGLIANHYFQIPIELFAAVFNITMFILAILVLGKSFALTSLISTFYFPVILGVFQKVEVLQHLTDDLMLCTIFSGLCIGVGIGMVIKVGASTGGMDIPPLIFNKKVGLPVSVGLYVFDFSILIGQMFFRDTEKSLYGILLVIIYTVLVDKVLLMGKNQMQVKIISDEYKKINTMIHQKLDRGTTLYKTETGYLHKDGFAIFTVVSNRELPKLNEMVLEIDNKAFMVINQVNEVKGRGFTLRKIKM